MAYLHCHSCSWAQDDFYTKRYNPITKIRDSIKWLWKPRIIGFDGWVIQDIAKYTHVPVVHKNNRVFTWNWLIVEIAKELKLVFRQRWWTWRSFEKEPNKVCPSCGSGKLDID